MVPWHEPTCLTRTLRHAAGPDGPNREILLEGSFAQVAKAFLRFHVADWDMLMICFTERQVPPFRYEACDFSRHVVARWIANEC
jgi:hypothetical protein